MINQHLGIGLVSALLITTCSFQAFASTPTVTKQTPFMQTPENGWSRFVMSYESEESPFSIGEIAIECNAKDQTVFFDYFAYRMILKSDMHRDAFGEPIVKIELPVTGEDWVQWNGVFPLQISDGKTGKTINAPFLIQPYKLGGDTSASSSYFSKLNDGPMRPREVNLLKGSKKEISQWIKAEVIKSAVGNVEAPSFTISGTSKSGRPYSATFSMEDLQSQIANALSTYCK